MREEDERFVVHPRETYQQRIIFTKIEEIEKKIRTLDEKIDKMSKMLSDVLRKKENGRVLSPVKSQKIYGFEPEDEVD